MNEGFVAYKNLIDALKAVSVYWSPYSDESYYLIFGGAMEEDDTATYYLNLASLWSGTDWLDRRIADDKIQVKVTLSTDIFGDKYELIFSFFDKTKLQE